MKPGDKPIGFWRVPPNLTDAEFDKVVAEVAQQIVEAMNDQAEAGQEPPATPTRIVESVDGTVLGPGDRTT